MAGPRGAQRIHSRELRNDSCGIFRDAVLSILATIAKQERVRLSERTVAGLERARKQGRIGGRPRVVTDRAKVAELRAAGKSLGEIAAEMGLAKTTVARIAQESAGVGASRFQSWPAVCRARPGGGLRAPHCSS